MTNQQKSSVEKYLRGVKKHLCIHGSAKKEVLENIRADLTSYMETYEEATYEELVDTFDAPEEISAEYIREQDTAALYKSLSWRKCTTAASLVVALAAVTASGIYSHYCQEFYRRYASSCIASEEIIIVEYPCE